MTRYEYTKYRQEARETRFRQQGGKCFYCRKKCINPDRPTTGYTPEHNHATLEHLLDKFDKCKRGHKNQMKYLVMACYECNHNRGLERAAEFRAEAPVILPKTA